jgi:hypothetical protein
MSALSLLLLGAALAQEPPEVPELNAQLFRPSLDSRATLWTDDAGEARHLAWQGRGALHWVDDPLVLRSADGQELRVLGSALELDLMGGITLRGARVGAWVPVFLHASGDLEAGGAALGDLGLDLKYSLPIAHDSPVGFAVTGRLGLPTASSGLAIGSPGVSGELAAVVDLEVDQYLLAANLGTRFLPAAELTNTTVDDQLFLRLGGGYAVSDAGGLSLELGASFPWAEGLVAPSATPLEALLGGWYQPADPVTLRAGLGKGLSDGIGAPDWRAVLMVDVSALAAPKDDDGDGLANYDDACPTKPEDIDGWADDDGCPDPTPQVFITFVEANEIPVFGVVAASVDGGELLTGAAEYSLALQPGEHTISASSAGYRSLDDSLRVPDQPKVMLRVVLEPLEGQLLLTARDPSGKAVQARWSVGEQERTGSPVGITLRQGGYELRVTAPGYRSQTRQVMVDGDESTELEVVLVPSGE